jgi:hypothetical protein
MAGEIIYFRRKERNIFGKIANFGQNGHFWAEKQKNQKSGIVRPSGLLKTLPRPKNWKKISIFRKVIKKMRFKKYQFFPFWAVSGQNHRKRANFEGLNLGRGAIFFDSVKSSWPPITSS